MQVLKLNLEEMPEPCDELTSESVGFWTRQFQLEPTPSQVKFDWLYGVGVPLLCVVADPIVFVDHGLLTDYRTFALVLSATSILAMAAWLLWRQKLGWFAAPLAGLFVAGSSVSCLVGLMILPYSIFGLFFLIGFLGFTPLFSTIVFLRNGVRALHASETFLERPVARRLALLTALFSLVVPYVLNVNR